MYLHIQNNLTEHSVAATLDSSATAPGDLTDPRVDVLDQPAPAVSWSPPP